MKGEVILDLPQSLRGKGVKSDKWITYMCEHHELITPFERSNVERIDNRFSSGVSHYGYDARLGTEFMVATNKYGNITEIDPKDPNPNAFQKISLKEGEYVVVPSGSFVLAKSLEYFKIPREVIALCWIKSSYGRNGIQSTVTPLEPEWEGYVTFTIVNHGPWGVRLYPFEGIVQVMFFEGDEPCAVSYADKKGRYQKQNSITLSKG